MFGKGGGGPDPKRGQVRLSWALGKENLTQTGTAQAFKGHFLISPPVTAVLQTLLPTCRSLTMVGFGTWKTGRITCPSTALLCLHNTWLSLCKWSGCKMIPSRSSEQRLWTQVGLGKGKSKWWLIRIRAAYCEPNVAAHITWVISRLQTCTIKKTIFITSGSLIFHAKKCQGDCPLTASHLPLSAAQGYFPSLPSCWHRCRVGWVREAFTAVTQDSNSYEFQHCLQDRCLQLLPWQLTERTFSHWWEVSIDLTPAVDRLQKYW